MTHTATLTDSQHAALAEIAARLQYRSAVVTLVGYAGTGKTWLIRHLLRELEAAGWRILLTAPTHQALRIAREGVPAGVDVATIHSALGLRVVSHPDGSQSTRPHRAPSVARYDLIVVDEASMVGSDLYARLMQARSCAVLFVGDPGQLPPVRERGEPGGAPESPAFSEVAVQVRLTEIVRQARGSATIAIAHEVRRYAENAQRVPIEAVRPLATHQAYMASGGLLTVADLVVEARQSGYEPVALAYRNDTVDRINALVHQRLHPNAPGTFVPGERILFRSPFHGGRAQHEMPIAVTNEYGTVLDAPPPTEGPAGLGVIRLAVQLESGEEHIVPVPVNKRLWQDTVDALFREQRAARSRRDLEPDPDRRHEHDRAAALASISAWELRSSLANVQHTYAMTAHRSQGSTFDIAILHWSDLDHIRSDFEHARAVYVAATRPSLYLAIVE